jgi:hypothetical protein
MRPRPLSPCCRPRCALRRAAARGAAVPATQARAAPADQQRRLEPRQGHVGRGDLVQKGDGLRVRGCRRPPRSQRGAWAPRPVELLFPRQGRFRDCTSSAPTALAHGHLDRGSPQACSAGCGTAVVLAGPRSWQAVQRAHTRRARAGQRRPRIAAEPMAWVTPHSLGGNAGAACFMGDRSEPALGHEAGSVQGASVKPGPRMAHASQPGPRAGSLQRIKIFSVCTVWTAGWGWGEGRARARGGGGPKPWDPPTSQAAAAPWAPARPRIQPLSGALALVCRFIEVVRRSKRQGRAHRPTKSPVAHPPSPSSPLPRAPRHQGFVVVLKALSFFTGLPELALVTARHHRGRPRNGEPERL